MPVKKNNRCDWKFHHEGKDNKPYYVECKICGRIKRSDLPDIQPCSGSNMAYKSMMKKILGQEVSETDVRDFENEYIESEENNENE